MNEGEGAVRPLSGEVALLTGGSRGIGLATARKLTEAGAAVALVARDRSVLDQAVRSLSAHGGMALAVVGDVTDPRSMESAVERTVERLLGDRTVPTDGAVVDQDAQVAKPLDEWRRVIEINQTPGGHGTRSSLRTSAPRSAGSARRASHPGTRHR